MLKNHDYLKCNQDKISIDELEYIPLPRSPREHEVDGREFYNKIEINKSNRQIQNAYASKNYEKAIDLMKKLRYEDRSRYINKLLYLSYKHTIYNLMQHKRLKTTLSIYDEMFNETPEYITSEDKKKYNNVSYLIDLGINKDTHSEYVYQKEYRSLFKIDIHLSKTSEINNIEKIPLAERIKKYFKYYKFINDVVLFIDMQGSILKKNKRTNIEYVLDHDIWKYDLDTNYEYIIILSTNCLLYIYDINISLLSSIDLKKDDRLRKHFKENQPPWKKYDKFNFIHSISLDYSINRVIFNIGHELIFYNLEGNILYIISMPTQISWENYIYSSNNKSKTSDIQNALKTLGLQLPVDFDKIKKQYKQLSFEYHPDLNPNMSDAKKRMQEINNAFSILTGIDPKCINESTSTLPTFYYLNKDSYIIKEDRLGSLSDQGADFVKGGMLDSKGRLIHNSTQDIIFYIKVNNYDDTVYISTNTTNKVYQFYQDTPCRVFDLGIGEPAFDIEFSKNYIFFSTRTRIYILDNNLQLVNFINHSKELLHIFEDTFCLLKDRYARFYNFCGKLLAEIRTEHIITCIYPIESNIIIETRQNRAYLNLNHN